MKPEFYSYLVSPVNSLQGLISNTMISSVSPHFPLATDIPQINELNKKFVYLVPIRSYYSLAVSDTPGYLKLFGLKLCEYPANYLLGLPVAIKDHYQEFDDQHIIALSYPNKLMFTPAHAGKDYIVGPLGLWFAQDGVQLTIRENFISEYRMGKCIILAEKF